MAASMGFNRLLLLLFNVFSAPFISIFLYPQLCHAHVDARFFITVYCFDFFN